MNTTNQKLNTIKVPMIFTGVCNVVIPVTEFDAPTTEAINECMAVIEECKANKKVNPLTPDIKHVAFYLMY